MNNPTTGNPGGTPTSPPGGGEADKNQPGRDNETEEQRREREQREQRERDNR